MAVALAPRSSTCTHQPSGGVLGKRGWQNGRAALS
jgi:hypothetical protein